MVDDNPSNASNHAATESGALNVAQQLELGAHFALAERAAHIGYWRHELRTGLQHWSPGFFAMMGIDPTTVRPSGSYLMERIHPDDRDAVNREIAMAVATGRPFHYRTRTWNLEGEERTFDTHGEVERGADGAIVTLLGVVREVTREVAAERKLKESEAAYRLIMEEATDMISRHDRNGVTTFVSPAVRQLLGYEPEDIINRPVSDLAHPDDLRGATSSILDTHASDTAITFEHRRRHRDGHFVWLESRVRYVMNSETGEPDHAISVTRDISRRKAFEDELLAAREKAESANYTKSRFLANMSHELRTPLNAIIGFSDIMVREMFGPIGNQRYAEYSKLVHESGSLLLDLINDLLDMSKIEAGKYELYLEDFQVGEPIAAALQMLSSRAAEKGLALSSVVEPERLSLRADQRVVKQVLLNLLSNAVKFSNIGGRIEVRAIQGDEAMVLSVEDNGIGIPPEFLSKIAQPFEQASNDPARTHGGSGLGLALVKSLVALHGGEFGVESTLGKGTRVTVKLPLVCQAPGKAA
jgi:PAS domain S-box-containing protein